MCDLALEVTLRHQHCIRGLATQQRAEYNTLLLPEHWSTITLWLGSIL